MKPLQLNYCDLCQKELPLGSTKYNVHIEIASDWDGYLPESAGHASAEEVLEQAARLDAETLENQVHMELSLLLCPTCRERFLENLDLATEGKPMIKTKSSMSLQ